MKFLIIECKNINCILPHVADDTDCDTPNGLEKLFDIAKENLLKQISYDSFLEQLCVLLSYLVNEQMVNGETLFNFVIESEK